MKLLKAEYRRDVHFEEPIIIDHIGVTEGITELVLRN
jgi:hypothetical protein